MQRHFPMLYPSYFLLQISASDKDKGRALTYTLQNDFDGLFYIDNKTALLSINNENKVMNFNKKKFYLLQLEVTDGMKKVLMY